MQPILFELGPLRVPAYGTLLALGFLAALALCRRLARCAGLSPRRLTELACWLVIGGGLGSRLAFVLQDPAQLADSPLAPLELWRGGAVWYGGVIGGVVALAWCRRRQGFSLWRAGDVVTPALALGHAFGRLGCFLAGCCFGRESDVAWAVSSRKAACAAHRGSPSTRRSSTKRRASW